MGWEMLPPEQSIWMSRACPTECIKEREQLQSDLDCAILERDFLLDEKAKIQAECDRLKAENEELKKELDKFKPGIIDVSEYYPD